jgi:hypothetical protein
MSTIGAIVVGDGLAGGIVTTGTLVAGRGEGLGVTAFGGLLGAVDG